MWSETVICMLWLICFACCCVCSVQDHWFGARELSLSHSLDLSSLRARSLSPVRWPLACTFYFLFPSPLQFPQLICRCCVSCASCTFSHPLSYVFSLTVTPLFSLACDHCLSLPSARVPCALSLIYLLYPHPHSRALSLSLSQGCNTVTGSKFVGGRGWV